MKEDVKESVAIALNERIEDFPGVSIVEDWQRVYPYAPLAATSSATWARSPPRTRRTTTDSATTRRVGGERVGRSGVEQSMEEVLHGKWGEVVYEVDANNRIVREISYEAPVNGMDVQLSIDLEYQQYAERLLQTQLRLRRQFTVANPEVERFQHDGTVRPSRWTRASPSAPRSPTRRRPDR